jgi:hypothetical protein
VKLQSPVYFKSRLEAPLEKKTKREGKEKKLKEEAKISIGPCPQGCEDQICILVSFKLLFHHL